MRPIGQDHVLPYLERQLPPVVALLGPPSCGKRTMAEHLARHHGVVGPDFLWHNRVGAEAARRLKGFLGLKPTGLLKVVGLRVDDMSAAAANALLAAIEEPGASVRVILCSTGRIPLTLLSRSQPYRLRPIPPDLMETLLIERFEFAPARAKRAALAASGSVAEALRYAQVEVDKGPTISALKAAAEGNEEVLYLVLPKIKARQVALLRKWAVEARTGRWRLFQASEGFGLQRDPKARTAIEKGLEVRARPRLVVRAALGPVLDERRGV